MLHYVIDNVQRLHYCNYTGDGVGPTLNGADFRPCETSETAERGEARHLALIKAKPTGRPRKRRHNGTRAEPAAPGRSGWCGYQIPDDASHQTNRLAVGPCGGTQGGEPSCQQKGSDT